MTVAVKPRILFLNRSYWPDAEATGQLLTELCEGLTEDFDVHVLAGKPNTTTHVEDWQNTRKRNHVTIHRVAHCRFPKNNLLLKTLNFLSFAWACRRQVLKLPRPDVVVFETDPFLLPFVADRLKRKTRCRMIGYLQDIYPDVAVALGVVSNNWMIRSLRGKLFAIYRRCDAMVVLSSDMKSVLTEDKIDEGRISVVPNWANTERIFPVNSLNKFRTEHGLDKKFVAMYSGNLGLTQQLEDFVEAAAILREDDDIRFVFVGRGARRDSLQQQVRNLNLKNVLFLDYQPLDQLAQSLSAADLHLVPMNSDLCRCLMPSKVYGILAAGRPYLTTAPEGCELFSLTKDEDVGITVPTSAPQLLATTIREAKSDPDRLLAMRQKARRLAESRFSRQQAVAAFRSLLATTTSPAGSRTT